MLPKNNNLFPFPFIVHCPFSFKFCPPANLKVAKDIKNIKKRSVTCVIRFVSCAKKLRFICSPIDWNLFAAIDFNCFTDKRRCTTSVLVYIVLEAFICNIHLTKTH